MSGFLNWPGWVHLILAECVAGLLLAASFVVRYHRRTRGAWRRSREGRWMLYGRLVIASVLALTLINNLFRGWPGQLFVSFVFFSIYVGHLYWPHLLLSRADREAREKERIPHDQAGSEDQGGELGNVPRVPGRAGVARRGEY